MLRDASVKEPLSSLLLVNVSYWPVCDMPSDTTNVGSLWRTGSNRLTAETALLALTGMRRNDAPASAGDGKLGVALV